MLRQNGNGSMSLSPAGKVGVGVLTALITAAALGAGSAALNVSVVRSDVEAMKTQMDDLERRLVAGNTRQIQDLRDRLSRLEGEVRRCIDQ